MGLFDLFFRKSSLIESDVLSGCVDSHSHILFGVDDGIRTIEESLEVLSLEEKAGIKSVWCTPHIMEDLPNTTEALKTRFSDLKSSYNGKIELHLAAEYMLDNLFLDRFRSGDLLTFEDDSVLVETSTWNPPPALYDTLSDMLKAGYRPLLAHPERYRYMNDQDYERLHAMGIHFQLNLPSIVGYYGDSTQKRAKWILEKGWYRCVGTDCHRHRVLDAQFNRKTLDKGIINLVRLISVR